LKTCTTEIVSDKQVNKGNQNERRKRDNPKDRH